MNKTEDINKINHGIKPIKPSKFHHMKNQNKRFLNRCIVLSLATALAMIFNMQVIFASHFFGGQIAYTATGGSNYKVILSLYRDRCFPVLEYLVGLTVNS